MALVRVGGVVLPKMFKLMPPIILAVIMLSFEASGRAESSPTLTVADEDNLRTSVTGSHDSSPTNYFDDRSWLSQERLHLEWFRCRRLLAHEHGPRFRLTEFNIYPTFSYLRGQSATYNEFEFASHTDLGVLEMENRTVLNVADLPSTIKLGPTNPGDLPAQWAFEEWIR